VIMSIDERIKEMVNERVDERLPQLVSEQLEQVKPLPVWMTETQLAEYWQLRNKEGELTTHSIRAWTVREKDPLPCANMGDMRRYNREEADGWARAEAKRQRTKNEQRKGRNGLQAVESQAS
jgi:hypothetical protein